MCNYNNDIERNEFEKACKQAFEEEWERSFGSYENIGIKTAYEQAFRRAFEKGWAQGIAQCIVNLMRNAKVGFEEAARLLDVPSENLETCRALVEELTIKEQG